MFEVQYAGLTSDKSEVLYDSNQDDIDRKHVWRVPASGGKPMPVTSGKGLEWATTHTAANKDIVVLASGATHPAHPARIDSKKEVQWLAPEAIPDLPGSRRNIWWSRSRPSFRLLTE